MNRNYFVAHAQVLGPGAMQDDFVRVSIVAVLSGTEQEIRDRIALSSDFAPGTYMLLEKNVPLVMKSGGRS